MRRLGLVLVALGCAASLVLLAWLTRDTRPRLAAQPESESSATSATERRRVDTPRADLEGAFFTDITSQSKLDFQHVVGPLGTYFLPEVNGSGGAMFDYDGDGDLDIYLVNAGRSPEAIGEFPPGTRVENRLFRQEADHTFTDVTEESGLGDLGYGIGCAVGDVDNDGDLDVYITNYGRDRLYLNQGDGTFVDVTEAAGIINDEWATCAAFTDYDRDGKLDLIVVNYTAPDPEYGHSVACGFTPTKVSYCSPRKFGTTVDRLFHNETEVDENGQVVVRFRDVTEEAGLTGGPTYGFGVICADFSRDGWPDLFIASDMLPNRLWINQRDGTFKDEAVGRGVAHNGLGLSQGCMGVAVGDPDNDGDLDLLITNLITEGAILYENDGQGFFRDATRDTRLDRLTRAHTGWGVAFIDVDHNGHEDVAMVNGFVVPGVGSFPPHGEDVFRVRRDTVPYPDAFWKPYADDNLLLWNDGEGKFLDATHAAGAVCQTVASARAMIYGDIDNDGDIDLLVTNVGQAARLYRNDAPKNGHWLRIAAIDERLRRHAIGAEIVVTAGGREHHRLVYPYGSYLASNDPRVHVGLGDHAAYDEILVRWPDGLVERFGAGAADTEVELRRGSGIPDDTEQALTRR